MCGHNLFGHLDGSIIAPSRTSSQNNQQITNPAYLVWFHQDQFIQNVIMDSIEPTLIDTIAVVDTAKVAQDALHITYANKSQRRIFSLRDQLTRVLKDTHFVANYIN